MNTKSLIAATVLSLIGSVALASEASPAPVERGQLTRAEVQAELARAQAAGELRFAGDSYGLQWVYSGPKKIDLPQFARSRDEVRQEARSASRLPKFNELYVGG